MTTQTKDEKSRYYIRDPPVSGTPQKSIYESIYYLSTNLHQ